MPDIYVTFFVLLALFVVYKYKYKGKKHLFLYAFLFAFFLLMGFMSKGSIVLIIPLLAFLFISDVILKRDIKFWIYSVLFSVLIFVLYFFVMWLLTGDVFKRFEAIATNSYINPCSYDKQPNKKNFL